MLGPIVHRIGIPVETSANVVFSRRRDRCRQVDPVAVDDRRGDSETGNFHFPDDTCILCNVELNRRILGVAYAGCGRSPKLRPVSGNGQTGHQKTDCIFH